MAWQPDQNSLRDLAICLKDTLIGSDRQKRKQAEENLKQAKSQPDLWKYFTILAITAAQPASIGVSDSDWQTIRVAAAINLKNGLRHGYRQKPEPVEYLKANILTGLGDANSQVRNNVGSVITEVLRVAGVSSWPSLYSDLLNLASSSTDASAQDGATQALVKICEDHSEKLVREYDGLRPSDIMIPKLLDLFANPNPKVRTAALACINPFISLNPPALESRHNLLVAQLSSMMGDESTAVRRQVVKAFTLLIEVRPDIVLAYIEQLVDYILAQQKNQEDDDLAIEAADFWLTISGHEQLCRALEPFLNKVVPVLLECMVYSEEDVMLNEIDVDNDKEDKEEDIAPQFAKGKKPKIGDSAANGNSGTGRGGDDDELSEGEIEDSDDEDAEAEGIWTLRKCSAASLDSLALTFHDKIFSFMLAPLQVNLVSEEWPLRESAVLALGAIAPGCMEAIVPHLPELVPFLINLLNDPQPVVVQITCWNLGRYSAWICAQQEASARALYFEPVLQGLMNRMLDSNKKTQMSAGSAFALMLEQETSNLSGFVGPIADQFVRCFSTFKLKNFPVLYDCISMLSFWIPKAPNHQEATSKLMNAIFDRWEKLPADSRELFAIIEMLSGVASNLGELFAPYAQTIYTKVMHIIAQNLEIRIAAKDNPDIEIPDSDYLVVSLDMISYLLQALGPNLAPQLLETTQPHLREVLPYCLQDSEYDVRQSAFALLGDVAIFVFPEIQNAVEQWFNIILSQLVALHAGHQDRYRTSKVLNNVCWSSGEIFLQKPKNVEQFMEPLYQHYLNIINDKDGLPSLHENAAFAIGRLGIAAPEVLSSHLSQMMMPYMRIMLKHGATLERDSSFQGFCAGLMLKPEAIDDKLPMLLNIIGLWTLDLQHMQPDLYQTFQNILGGYQQLVPNFSQVLSTLQPQTQAIIRQAYKVA